MSQLYDLQKTNQPLKVLIIGAGTGGLSLAQGLKSDGISVQVFERDQAPFDRQAGYRLSINRTGNRALKECLPESLFQILVKNSVKPSRGVSFLDERMKPLLTIDIPETNPYSVDSERPITRIALRRVLLDGLNGIVQFGKKFVGFEDAPGARVSVRFEDRSSAIGDVLVGADGANSRVRSQLLPHAERIETGVLAVSGKLSLNDGVRAMTPPAVFRGPTLVMGPKGCFLFANAVEYADEKAKDANTRDNFNSNRLGLVVCKPRGICDVGFFCAPGEVCLNPWSRNATARRPENSGFRAVCLSLENMERLHSEGLSKVLAKFAFRLMNALPPLKERFRSGR
jgi:hypothetical protein